MTKYECQLHARVPRIKRDDGKVRLIPTPWEGKVSGFTLLFEALLLQLCKAMPVFLSPCLDSNTSTKSTTVL
jgi:hypothetical protein